MSQNLRYAPAHEEAGVWLLRQSRWQEAIERFRMALSIDPGDAEAHARLAAALQAARRAAEAHRQRGLAADARGLRARALQEYQAWAALDRQDPEAEIQVAQAYISMNRFQEARARLEAARRRFPREAALRERLIAVDILGLDRARARRLCEEWRREEPGSAQAVWLLGRIAEVEQQPAEAVHWYEQALAMQPDKPQWWGTLGEAMLALPGSEAVPRAVAALARAVVGDPDEPRWHLALAEGLMRLGRTDDARRQALRALDLDPNQVRAYNLILQCASQEADPHGGTGSGPVLLFASLLRAVEARQREELPLRQATWEHSRDPAALAALAGFFLRAGDPAAAEGFEAEAVRLSPDWAEGRARLALIRRLREVL
jgi:tetratricopeptide (TPR) repeat protein